MKILVVIVTYNGMKWLQRCLESVSQSFFQADLYIVDNGSTDGTIQFIRESYPNVKFVQSKINLGFGKANNMGIQYALKNNYDYVYLLNQDAWIYPDTIEKLVGINKKYPEYGILSPFQLQADNNHMEPIFGGGVCSRHSNKDLLDDLYFNRIKEVYQVPEVQAAHWLISDRCLNKVGCFSPTFPHYGEDNNYQDRVYYHGLKVGIVPSARAVHDSVPQKDYKKEKTIRLLAYISYLVKYSGINSDCQINLVSLFFEEFYYFLRYRSLMPFKYYFKLISEISKIKMNKNKSRKEGAFLNL